MTTPAIEAIGLSKRFVVHSERRRTVKEIFARGRAAEKRYFWALRDATFAVPKGSSLGIIGHNGSGKSTALKVLTGIYRPTAGHVQVNGSVAAMLEVGAGFHPELSGRQNIRLNATILGFTGRQIDAMMDQIVEFADIGDHIDAPIKHYSSGMYVRLGFAVAVMVKPEILIVDEVIAVGDLEFQRKCYDHLRGLRQSGTTLVIVSHGLGNITDLCDDALWLDHGDVQRLGPALEVTRAYMDSVNAKEAARGAGARATVPVRAGVGSAAASVATVRRGNGKLRIESVTFLDAAQRPQPFLLAGQPGTIRLTCRSEAPCSVSAVRLDVHDDSEALIVHLPTPAGQSWELAGGVGTIDFQASPLLLAPGGYRLRAEVEVAGHLADALDTPTDLRVRGTQDVETAGAYLQPGDWQLRSAVAPVG